MNLLVQYPVFKVAILLLPFLTISFNSDAQDIGPEALVAASGSGETDDLQLNWVVGGLIATPLSSEGITLTEGAFPSSGLVVEPLSVIDNTIRLEVYPNPVVEHLTVNYSQSSSKGLELQVYDFMGREVLNDTEDYLTKTDVDFSHLPAGTYFLHVRLKSSDDIKKFKILKTN